MTALPIPEDLARVADYPDCFCGHGALAAAAGCAIITARKFLDGGWVNIPMMKSAMERISGRPVSSMGEAALLGSTLPEDARAVVMVQWLGPWMAHKMRACTQRHWIAFRAGYFWDVNEGSWMKPETWEATVAPMLYPQKCTGHAFLRTLYYIPQNDPVS